MHDRVIAEFVNVGIVVHQPDTKILQSKCITKLCRLSPFFIDINGQYLLSTLKQFERELETASKGLTEIFTTHTSLTEIKNSILPKDERHYFVLICISELTFTHKVQLTICLTD